MAFSNHLILKLNSNYTLEMFIFVLFGLKKFLINQTYIISRCFVRCQSAGRFWRVLAVVVVGRQVELVYNHRDN